MTPQEKIKQAEKLLNEALEEIAITTNNKPVFDFFLTEELGELNNKVIFRVITMSDFAPSNDVKYFDKDEEINHQDGFISDAIKDFKVSHKLKTKEELMSDNESVKSFIEGDASHLVRAHGVLSDRTSNIRIGDELIDNKKVRTKTEFVRVTEYESELDDDLVSGNLYASTIDTSNFIKIKSKEVLSKVYDQSFDGHVYRKVKVKTLWQDEVIDLMKQSDFNGFTDDIKVNRFLGLKTKNYQTFINMCRLVVDSVKGE